MRLKEVRAYSIQAIDGHPGRVVDLLFDDKTWAVRYIVVETGRWLHHRRGLLLPIVLNAVDNGERRLRVDLTCEEVTDSPPLDDAFPLFRQMEARYRDYFAWPWYWIAGFYEPFDGTSQARSYAVAQAIQAHTARRRGRLGDARRPNDPHLRSAAKIIGYHVMARDGLVGHVTDFHLDVEGGAWRVRDLVVDTGGWMRQGSATVAAAWIEDINWATSTVKLSVPRDMVAARARLRLRRDAWTERLADLVPLGRRSPNEHARVAANGRVQGGAHSKDG